MTHILADNYQLPADDILEIIRRSPRCEQMVKEFVAEFHLERIFKTLLGDDKITGFKRLDDDGQPDFEAYPGRNTIQVECKMFMSGRQYKNGDYKVDFQRIRHSTIDPRSRHYRRSDFQILAACTYNQNQRWDFVYIKTKHLPLDIEAGEDCLVKAVRYNPQAPFWTSSIEEVLDLKPKTRVSRPSNQTLDNLIY